MAKARFLLDTALQDSEAPGFYSLRLDTAKLARRLSGEPTIYRLCRKMGLTAAEVIREFTPGAYLDPATGEVELSAGYDPDHDEGSLEALIWFEVRVEVLHDLGAK